MGFRIDKSKIDRTFADLASRVRKPLRLLKTWGNSVAKSARANALEKGGTNFWRGIARSVRLKQASESSMIVGSNHFAAAQKQFGGEIRAKKKQALTIPVSPEAKGKTAKEFKSGGRPLFVVRGNLEGKDTLGLLGYSAHGEFFPMFVLRKSVKQKAEPWFPEEAEITSLGMKEAAFWLEKEARSAAR